MEEEDDFLFPDSSTSVKKRSNIMDELLGKSDVLETAKSTPFTLGNAAKPQLPATERQGRRGISPTLKPVPVEKKNVGLDWLELKGDSEEKDQPISSSSKEKKAPSYLDWLTPKQNQDSNNKTDERSRAKVTEVDETPNVKSAKSEMSTAVELAPVPVQLPVPSATTIPTKIPSIADEFISRANQLGSTHLNDSSSGVFELQSKVNHSEFEVRQLKNELESVQRKHMEELEAIEASFKRRCQLVEESYQRRETQLQEEVRLLQESAVGRAHAWERERAEVVSGWQRRLDEVGAERVGEAERMREAQHRMLVGMSREHEEAIERLKRIQRTEVDAVNEAQQHTNTLSQVIDQLRGNTLELNELQAKVSVGMQSGSREMEVLLRGKEDQVQQLKAQVGVVREEEERHKTQLRKTILQLEERLNRQEEELEQERWKTREERSRLELERKAAEERIKTANEEIESEKRTIERQKSWLLNEQRVTLDTQHTTFLKDNQVGGSKWVAEEKERLREERERVEADGRTLEVRRMGLEQEKASLDALLGQLKQRSEQVEQMCLSASASREEGFVAAREAARAAADVKKRQEAVWSALEEVKRREKRVAEDRLTLAKERRHVELLRERLLCVRCQFSLTSDPALQTDEQFLARESRYLQKLPFYLATHRIS